MTKQYETGQNWTKQDKAGQNKKKQDKTGENSLFVCFTSANLVFPLVLDFLSAHYARRSATKLASMEESLSSGGEEE